MSKKKKYNYCEETTSFNEQKELSWMNYSGLLDMEVELGLLRHVLGCDECQVTIRERISGDGRSEIGTIGKLFNDAIGVNVVDLDELVERRIRQRIEQLERLKVDADLELEDLRRNLEPLIHHDRG